jgi:hypothetical protein
VKNGLEPADPSRLWYKVLLKTCTLEEPCDSVFYNLTRYNLELFEKDHSSDLVLLLFPPFFFGLPGNGEVVEVPGSAQA